jgi:TetR/AcrR family transcriptional regulator, fatty acid metabolism regulator protein
LDKTPETPAVSRGGEKYDRILEAAIDVIAEKGFHHARISDIASRAGVADGTVYLYFENKDHILRAAIDSAFAQFSRRLTEALQQAKGIIEKLTVIARLHIETLINNRSLAVILQTEVRQSAKFMEQFSHQYFVDYINVVREVIREGQQQQVVRPGVSDRIAALAIFGTLDEMISSWLYTGRSIDPEQTASEVLDILLNGLSPRPKND